MKRPAFQNKQVGVLRMAFRARKVFGTFEKQAPRNKISREYTLDPRIDIKTTAGIPFMSKKYIFLPPEKLSLVVMISRIF